MKPHVIAALAATLSLGACAAVPAEPEPVAPGQPAPPPADARAIPAGTILNVTLQQEVGLADSRVGDRFTVMVTDALVATNNQTVVPAEAVITGMVTGVAPAAEGRPAAIRLNFLRISIEGVSHPITAGIVATQPPDDEAGVHARGIVTSAAEAAAGAVLGGELRDTLVSAALGAGAGTIVSLGTGQAAPTLPQGTRLTIQTASRVQLR